MIKTHNGIPVYLASLVSPEEGIFDVSLVQDPATFQDFVLFGQDKMNFSVIDEEERIVSGVLMLCNVPVYRKSPTLGEYYIIFNRDTLKALAERLFQESRQNNITLDHNEELIQGVTMLELFIKDSEKGISPSYLENVPDGSLIASYKINNPELWKEIKEGTFRGFSISGLFTAVPDNAPSELDEVLDLLHQLEGKLSL